MKVSIKNKSFGEKVVLSSLSLDFPEREISLLMAPSGWGKTTLLRILASLDSDFNGKIERNDGRSVILFQEDRLVDNISVLSNLRAIGAEDENSLKLLSEMGLEGEEKTLIRNLSGGMKRRVSIARALLKDGEYYFLDEPFSGLDYETKKKCAEIMKRVLKNKTVIAVSHNKEDGELLGATKTLVIGEDDGRES